MSRKYDHPSISEEFNRYVKLVEKELAESPDIARDEIINYLFIKLNEKIIETHTGRWGHNPETLQKAIGTPEEISIMIVL